MNRVADTPGMKCWLLGDISSKLLETDAPSVSRDLR